MGKIHEALQRAEEQRAKLAGKPRAVEPDELLARVAPLPDVDVEELAEIDPEDSTRKQRRAARKLEKSARKQTRRAARLANKEARRSRGAEERPSGLRRLVPFAHWRSEKRSQKRERERLLAVRRSRLMVGTSGMAVSEEYRTLRARLQSLRRVRPIRSLVVTSSRPGEGKTTTAVNLALSFGLDLETRTCLVDADLRTPSVGDVFPTSPVAGLGEVLEGDAKLEDALIQVPDTRLSVLPVKAQPAHPSEMLGSRAMIDLIEELHSRFDTIVIDAPPVLGLPDTVTLVDLCDATLLVVGAANTPRDQVESTLEALDPSKIVGSVLNRCAKASTLYGGSSSSGR